MPPRASFLFKRALVQDIAYSMLLLGLRRSLHGQIARALEERFRGAMEGRPETLAHHFTEAGLLEKAVGYWCRAGRQSVAKSGFVEAITQLRTGLRLIADLPDNTTAAAVSLAVGGTGLVRIKTAVLLTPDEVDRAAHTTVGYRAPGK